jgi:branched-subunit amino acid aminotransferase/4-amino-4-deoxychorismate lyase
LVREVNSATVVEQGFYLFETLCGARETGLRYLDRHLARLAASAQTLAFDCDLERIRNEAMRQGAELPEDGPYRVRIRLERSGMFEVNHAPLGPLGATPITLLLGADWGLAPQYSSNPLLLHKTSLRGDYDSGWKLAESLGAFDMLFLNERGELTEGGRSNLFLRLKDRWWTPPLSSGVLPGIMRELLLADRSFDAGERVLSFSDLLDAEDILLCNSLRGVMQARLLRRKSLSGEAEGESSLERTDF